MTDINRKSVTNVKVSAIRHETPIGAWDGTLAQPAETMLASRTLPIRMATAGYYRNVANGMFDAVWTSRSNQWALRMACRSIGCSSCGHDGEVPFCHKWASAHKMLIENTSHVAGNAIELKLDDFCVGMLTKLPL